MEDYHSFDCVCHDRFVRLDSLCSVERNVWNVAQNPGNERPKNSKKISLKGSTRLARTHARSAFCGTEGSHLPGVSAVDREETVPASVKQQVIDFIPTSFFIV